MRHLASGIAFMAALNIPCVTSTQSLGDVARVAEARRRQAAATRSARVHLNEDLVELPTLLERLENDRALAAATGACAEGLPADADACFRVGVVCEHYLDVGKTQAECERLLAVIEPDEQAVRDLEEEGAAGRGPPRIAAALVPSSTASRRCPPCRPALSCPNGPALMGSIPV